MTKLEEMMAEFRKLIQGTPLEGVFGNSEALERQAELAHRSDATFEHIGRMNGEFAEYADEIRQRVPGMAEDMQGVLRGVETELEAVKERAEGWSKTFADKLPQIVEKVNNIVNVLEEFIQKLSATLAEVFKPAAKTTHE